jgi:hypothetical protein
LFIASTRIVKRKGRSGSRRDKQIYGKESAFVKANQAALHKPEHTLINETGWFTASHHHYPQRPNEHTDTHHERGNRVKPIRQQGAMRHHVSVSFVSTKKHTMTRLLRNKVDLP